MKHSKANLLLFFSLFFLLFALVMGHQLLALKDETTQVPKIFGVVKSEQNVITLLSAPDPQANVLAVLNQELYVEVLDSSSNDAGDWYQIKTESEIGWILAADLSIVKSDAYQINASMMIEK